MKYKVVANDTVITSSCSAKQALNAVISILQGHSAGEKLDVKVYYQAGNDTVGYCWKLENSFTLGL